MNKEYNILNLGVKFSKNAGFNDFSDLARSCMRWDKSSIEKMKIDKNHTFYYNKFYIDIKNILKAIYIYHLVN